MNKNAYTDFFQKKTKTDDDKTKNRQANTKDKVIAFLLLINLT